MDTGNFNIISISEFMILALSRTFIIFFFLILPDIVFIGKNLLIGDRKTVTRSALLILLASFFLAIGSPIWLVFVILLILYIFSLAWHLTFAYFGDTIKPELFILFLKPDHFADTVAATFDDARRLAPVAGVILLSISATLIALSMIPAPHVWLSDYAPYFAITIFSLFAFHSIFHRNENVVYPSVSMLGPIGTIYAIARPIHWTFNDQFLAPPKRNSSLSYSLGALDDDPVTVVVLMGESIAARRMSIYGGVKGTTPRLEKRKADDGEYRLFTHLGFSFGCASNSSIAAFLSGSPFPERRSDARSLFQIAKEQGFETAYISGQKRSPLDLTAGAAEVSNVITRESLDSIPGKVKDWALLDILENTPANNRSFFFVYPRVNHAPYYSYRLDKDEMYFAHPTNSEELLHNYDIGIRSFDQFTDKLFSTLQSRPGTVYAFVTSDHNEFLGENGIVGHNISGSLESAMVPVMLFTNRPDDPITADFASLKQPDAFQIAQLVLRAMGAQVRIKQFDEETFYVNNALPFGRAGYLSVARTAEPGIYEVIAYDRSGNGGDGKVVHYRL